VNIVLFSGNYNGPYIIIIFNERNKALHDQHVGNRLYTLIFVADVNQKFMNFSRRLFQKVICIIHYSVVFICIRFCFSNKLCRRRTVRYGVVSFSCPRLKREKPLRFVITMEFVLLINLINSSLSYCYDFFFFLFPS
jgi:hypothetical protein